MKSGTVRIYFLSEFSVCCHRNILLPWQRDVTMSPLYCKSVTLTSFARHNIGKKSVEALAAAVQCPVYVQFSLSECVFWHSEKLSVQHLLIQLKIKTTGFDYSEQRGNVLPRHRCNRPWKQCIVYTTVKRGRKAYCVYKLNILKIWKELLYDSFWTFGNKTIKFMFTDKKCFWAQLILAPWSRGQG